MTLALPSTSLVQVPVIGYSMAPTLRPGDILLVQLAPAPLQPGDIALFRQGSQLFAHRFLAYCRRQGQCTYLTKGDAHRGFDPLWPPQAFFGVVVSVVHGDETLPLTQTRWQRLWKVGISLLLGTMYRCYRWFVALLLLLCLAPPAHAAVHLISFTATWQGDAILVRWETASEVNSLGFNLYRTVLPASDEVLLNPDIIPAQGDITGASYQFLDQHLPPASGYQYRLEEIDTTGQTTSFTPISLSHTTATSTPTPTSPPTATTIPTPTPSPTIPPSPTSTLSPTPTPTVSPSPTSTLPPTSTATPTLAPSPTSSPTSTLTPTVTLSPSPTSTSTSTPFPTSTPTPLPPPVPTATYTPSPTLTPTPTPSLTPSPTLLPTSTPTSIPTATSTPLLTQTTPLPLFPTPAPPTSLPPRFPLLSTIFALIGFTSFTLAVILAAFLLWLRRRPPT